MSRLLSLVRRGLLPAARDLVSPTLLPTRPSPSRQSSRRATITRAPMSRSRHPHRPRSRRHHHQSRPSSSPRTIIRGGTTPRRNHDPHQHHRPNPQQDAHRRQHRIAFSHHQNFQHGSNRNYRNSDNLHNSLNLNDIARNHANSHNLLLLLLLLRRPSRNHQSSQRMCHLPLTRSPSPKTSSPTLLHSRKPSSPRSRPNRHPALARHSGRVSCGSSGCKARRRD